MSKKLAFTGYSDDDVMCPWYYVPTLLDNFIYIELVPETDLTKFTNN